MCSLVKWADTAFWLCTAVVREKVKVQFYSLISSLKTYHPTLSSDIRLYLTPWSLDLFIRVPFQLHGEHTVLQPFRRIELIVHIAISVLPGTHFHLSQVKHFRVKCLAKGHNILTISQNWEGRNMIFLLKILHGIRNHTAGSDISRAPRSNHCAMSLSIELLYNMYNEATPYHVVAESLSADVIVNRTIPRRWPSIETTRINVTCLLVYRAYILKCPGMWRPRFCVCWLVRNVYLVLWSA